MTEGTHNYTILFTQPTAANPDVSRGSTEEEALADIVISHDGKIIKDRFGNAHEVISRLIMSADKLERIRTLVDVAEAEET